MSWVNLEFPSVPSGHFHQSILPSAPTQVLLRRQPNSPCVSFLVTVSQFFS